MSEDAGFEKRYQGMLTLVLKYSRTIVNVVCNLKIE